MHFLCTGVANKIGGKKVRLGSLGIKLEPAINFVWYLLKFTEFNFPFQKVGKYRM